MKILIKYYFFEAVANGTLFFLVMGIFDIIRGEAFNLKQSLFMALFFGLLMALFYLVMVQRDLAKLGVKEINEAALKSHTYHVSSYDGGLSDIQEAIVNSRVVTKNQIEKSGDRLIVKVRKGLWKIGEYIVISESKNFSSLGHAYEIKIDSDKPIWLSDYSAMLKKFKRIVAVIERKG